ncbi:MAG TPA: hypothetical protein VMM82_11740 [Spirochaetia bacterium]|nr:hypothetical protein [Spirochaetia bacterium]
MKRAIAVLVGGALLLAGVSVFAQAQPSSQAQPSTPPSNQQGYPKEAYAKNIPFFKILVHPLGYKIFFWKSDMSIGTMYVPLAWFHGGVVAKAAITYGASPDRPYVSISWVDGVFDHLTINAQEDMMGPTWGQLDPTLNLTSEFNIQEPSKDF